ncbi:M61 family metallopeptidase [Thauera sp. CAU 1555]|uniref:M61 family metallopeptidase n=1 Tax=Thauera sedimentorum TaxID=2767595 RepID=A0ABR9B8C0_9RHOO|nr:PDZ domain-containing protein [Thauera sedimentorum]MBC9071502.1 M61 family metallopeptidase [Thauera sedimentorum]MBD8502421.1 M61 family metallopeptidase [Thauera sedimentorum]
MTTPIHYRIRPANPAAHLFEASVTVAEPDAEGQVFSLPAWIPGSYMIREFARNIVTIRAEADGKAVALEKLDKHSWRAARVPAGSALTLHYEVYAWDLSVRAAHLDQTHGFFNGTSVFLMVHGQAGRPCTVDIQPPADTGLRDWRVITALPRARGKGAAKAYGFGLYRAADYDELIDHPVEMGRFTLASFEAAGVPHDVALTGRHDCDMDRLTTDLKRICEWQVALFGAPAPMDYYAFLTMIVGDGYGGLEHRASTALLASRADLPYPGMKAMSEGYRQFLGLCSHEYFHTWNVKRIKPAAFTPYDLAVENHTGLLWAFEGFTSYYDDLALVRSGVIGVDDYLGLLGKTISNVLRGPGRLRQSVAESSFDAWTKYYRQDENAPNAIVSYYAKGSLVALALDLQLRAASAGENSLDDVMRLLWQRHGQTGTGVPEDGIFAAVEDIGGKTLARWLRRAVEGTDDLPLARLLKPFGVAWSAEPASAAPWLGAKLAAGNGETRLANVYDGGPAQRAGLSAGDVLVALDGLKIGASGLDAMLARRQPGERIALHAFRRDELMCFELELAAAPADKIGLKPAAKAPAAAARLRRGWLGS